MSDAWTLHDLLSFISLHNVLGATGAIFYVVAMSMKTAISLRIASLVSAVCLLGASILARSLPAIALYALLLPVHSIRLYQMLELIKKVRVAMGTDLSMNWLRPYMKKRKMPGRVTFSFAKAIPPTKCSWSAKASTGCSTWTTNFSRARFSGSWGC